MRKYMNEVADYKAIGLPNAIRHCDQQGLAALYAFSLNSGTWTCPQQQPDFYQALPSGNIISYYQCLKPLELENTFL